MGNDTVAVLFFPLVIRRARRLLKKCQSTQHVTAFTVGGFFLPHGNLAGNGSLERCASECKYRDDDGNKTCSRYVRPNVKTRARLNQQGGDAGLRKTAPYERAYCRGSRGKRRVLHGV